MNRSDWEKQIFASKLNANAKLVALVVGSFGNWKEDRTVWPSTVAIADMAGMHRDTVAKYVHELAEQGWLRLVRVRPKNVKEYELCKPVAEPLGILTDPLRRNQYTKLPNEQATESNQLPNKQAGSCLTSKIQLPNKQVPVAYPLGINLQEPTNMNLQEEPTNVSPIPDGPVDSDLLGSDSDSLNLEEQASIEVLENIEDVEQLQDVADSLNSKEDEAAFRERWMKEHTVNGVLYRNNRDLEEAKRRAQFTDDWSDVV